MDRHADQVISKGIRVVARRGLVLAALLLAPASGCVSTGPLVPESVPVNQVAAVWSPQVMPGVDPANHGAPMYGLAGRVFLYGADLHDNVLADGKLVVELYAPLPERPQEPPVCLQTWEIKKEILNAACLRKDSFGQGYTLNLPWLTYRPDLGQVQMRWRYEPAKGLPVYGQSPVTFNSASALAPAVATRTESGNGQPVTAAPPGPAPQAGSVQQAGGLQPAGGMPPPVQAQYQAPAQPTVAPPEPPVQTFQTPQPLPGAPGR
jgi:hypothetical protein